MNFQNLEYFIAVAREGNITRAAEQLNISQQALSNQIARIEQEVGARLFDRKHGFELTQAGRYFFDAANRVSDISRQTEAAISDIVKDKRGELKIGVSFTRGQALLPLVLPDFAAAHPHISLTIVEDLSVDLHEALDKGMVDLVIDYRPFRYDSIEFIDLMDEHAFLVVPRNILEKVFGPDIETGIRKYNKKPDLTVFADCPFVLLKHGEPVRTLLDNEFRLCGISPQIALETENIQTAFALASQGMGISVIPEFYSTSPYVIPGNTETNVRNHVELLRLSANTARTSFHIAVAYNRERYQSRAAKDFISICEKKFRQINKKYSS